MHIPKMNDQTKIIVCTAVALVGIDLMVRALMPPKVVYIGANPDSVTTHELRLTDKQGNLRAHLYTDSQGEPGLVLYDRAGRTRAQLDTWEAVPSLILFNPNGQRSTYFGMGFDGKAILNMYGERGDWEAPVASMSVSQENGIPGFTFRSNHQEHNGSITYQNGSLHRW
ncbi:MAG: hypothetical protein OHK0029_39780 [Armatimonadaceae bacterium]